MLLVMTTTDSKI